MDVSDTGVRQQHDDVVQSSSVVQVGVAAAPLHVCPSSPVEQVSRVCAASDSGAETFPPSRPATPLSGRTK